ncbi:LysE family transporter [Domibacillus epiphyticus]|uniref:Amino acid transporter n=1 Tax=Domibacillus epiphyticus TaxID=1714355 RepID=A0A1V2A672_9BACI|nr:LysE family transporter [Domibacillus epiphyticus]OMP66362.1 amino acid transporter [Domibacillus epiphyticus]
MNSILTYVFLGVSLAAPVGPVNAGQIDTGIKNGFFHAWIFGIGALTADAAYMAMVYLGVAQFIDSPFMKTLLWSFGCFVLTYTGVESLITAHKIEVKVKKGKAIPLKRSFLSGFLMSLLNPLTVLFWLGIYGSVLAETAESLTDNQLFLYSAAIIAGILCWDLLMAALSSVARRFLSSALLKMISIISSLSMFGFGIYFGIQAFRTLFL